MLDYALVKYISFMPHPLVAENTKGEKELCSTSLICDS